MKIFLIWISLLISANAFSGGAVGGGGDRPSAIGFSLETANPSLSKDIETMSADEFHQYELLLQMFNPERSSSIENEIIE